MESEVGFTWPMDTRPLLLTKGRNDENSSPDALNVKNGACVIEAWCPDSFKILHLDLVVVKSRLRILQRRSRQG